MQCDHLPHPLANINCILELGAQKNGLFSGFICQVCSDTIIIKVTKQHTKYGLPYGLVVHLYHCVAQIFIEHIQYTDWEMIK